MLQLIEIEGNINLLGTVKISGNINFNKAIVIQGDVHLAGKHSQVYPIYTGEYIVTPYAHRETLLDTDDKLMEDDVRVLEIPYTETSNLYGTTVAIATE